MPPSFDCVLINGTVVNHDGIGARDEAVAGQGARAGLAVIPADAPGSASFGPPWSIVAGTLVASHSRSAERPRSMRAHTHQTVSSKPMTSSRDNAGAVIERPSGANNSWSKR